MEPGHVEVQIAGRGAVAAGWAWVEGDATLLEMLRQDLRQRERTIGYDPFPALTLAEEAVALYGGRIVGQEPPEHTEGRVY